MFNILFALFGKDFSTVEYRIDTWKRWNKSKRAHWTTEMTTKSDLLFI